MEKIAIQVNPAYFIVVGGGGAVLWFVQTNQEQVIYPFTADMEAAGAVKLSFFHIDSRNISILDL